MDRVLGVLCLAVVLHVVDRVLAAAVYQSSGCGIGGVLRIQLVAGVLVSGSGNAALGNGNLCGIVIDPGCASHFHLVLFLLHTVDGVVHCVDGILCLALVLLPLCRQGHILRRHYERASLNLLRCQIIRSPAVKSVAGSGGNGANDLDCSSLIFIVGVMDSPNTACQIILHLIARYVLGIEIHIFSCHGVGEHHLAASTVLIGIPAIEGVCHATLSLRIRQILQSREVIGRSCLSIPIVSGCLPVIPGIAGIPQPVGRGADLFGLNLHGTVHMVRFVSGNLVGMQDNGINIIR